MPVLDLSAIAEDFNEKPYPHYARLCAQGPVHRVKTADGQEVWLIVGHQEARQALTHPAVFKNWLTAGLYTDREQTEASANMMRVDPPHHTRLRRLVAGSFAPGRIETLRPRIQEIVDRLLDGMDALPERRADLIGAFARPLPVTVICELLGVTSREDGGDRLSRRELVAMAVVMMVGGHETTTHLVSNGMRALLTHPDQLAALSARVGAPRFPDLREEPAALAWVPGTLVRGTARYPVCW